MPTLRQKGMKNIIFQELRLARNRKDRAPSRPGAPHLRPPIKCHKTSICDVRGETSLSRAGGLLSKPFSYNEKRLWKPVRASIGLAARNYLTKSAAAEPCETHTLAVVCSSHPFSRSTSVSFSNRISYTANQRTVAVADHSSLNLSPDYSHQVLVLS